MKYIKKIIIDQKEASDLGIGLVDNILGSNEEGHDYEIINEVPSKGFWWANESEDLDVNEALRIINKLKYNGATHVQIFNHSDHRGYYFYGVDIHEATKEEIKIFKDQEKKISESSR